ncbi:MAG: diguanylate cyclase [Lachnospiraceae bacterium]|nr:diguanylate cyclase [Lachnospiraceae bacterium]
MADDFKVKNGISQKLLVIVIIPMLLLTAVATIIGYNLTLSALTEQLKKELTTAAAMTGLTIDTLVPGDYSLTGDESLSLYKGETDITRRYELVDTVGEATGLELSLIYRDTRILTTIRDREGLRVVGTGLADQVKSKINVSPDGLFYDKTLINRENYFSYYYPLYNSDGTFTGAIEVCSPYSPVASLAWRSVLITSGLILAVMVLLIVLIFNHNKSSNIAIEKLLKFTKLASSGNDSAELDSSVISRDDELGSIGTSVLEMHRSMRDMMDKDALTKLFNRRSANRKLDLIRSHYEKDGKPYSVAIGDIDFFKKVNDTYGHDAGDLVLVTVANLLQKHLKPLGFVARWGGEEFLMVFDKLDLAPSEKELWNILEEMRATEIDYDGTILKVTMSFGVVCAPELPQDDLIKLADEHLYYAKESGRNRVTAFIPVEDSPVE